MVQPMNYMMDVADPVARTLEGYHQGIDAQTALAQRQLAQEAGARAQEMHPVQMAAAQQNIDIQAAQEARSQQVFQAQQEELQRQKDFRDSMGWLIGLGPEASFDDVASVASLFPEMQQAVLESYEALGEARRKPLLNSIAQGAAALKSGNVEVANQITEQFAQAAEAAGEASLAAQAKALGKLIDIDPKAAMAQAGVLLYSMDKELAKNVLGVGVGDRVQRSIPVGDGSVIQNIMRDGSIEIIEASTGRKLTGEEADRAVSAAMSGEVAQEKAVAGGKEAGTLEAKVDLGGAAAASAELGKESIKAAVGAFENLGKVRAGIANIDNAIAAIDSGAKSGIVNKYLPNITAASADLENTMNRMGLDVIGSVTFGALSEGEMRLAMETAVPRNLSPQDLRAWLVEKKDAQEKAADALYNAARYLSTPGNNINTWLEQQGMGGPADDDAAFVARIYDARQRGETISQQDMQRLQAIAAKRKGGQ